MTNEEFYKAEAEYWKAEAKRLANLMSEISNISSQVDPRYNNTPPEPPINTKYVIETEDGSAKAVWERHGDGWYCSVGHSEEGCKNCPETWNQVNEYWISKNAIRILPS